MLGLSLQRSPRPKSHNFVPSAASRLHKSASVPRLPPAFPQKRSPKPHILPDPDAPYPLSYENSSLNCDALDNTLLKKLAQSVSLVNFSSSTTPTRSLDLGCGVGAWIMDAAREWPECEFTGFDLVRIQPPLIALPPDMASRIQWVHGSFLKPLPFEDAYFDHIHIRQIARGVPEKKWDHIIAEVLRVLKDGGTIEIFEEDIIFPVLPRSSTANPRQQERKRSPVVTLAYPTSPSCITWNHPAYSLPSHDHALLETLFYRVFLRRGIHRRPTALLPALLATHLAAPPRASPFIIFPLPRAPPLPPGPDSRAPTPAPALPERDDDTETSGSSGGSNPSTSTAVEDPVDGSVAFYSDGGPHSTAAFLPEGRLAAVTDGTLGMNLYRSWQGVIACREAMWDEYCEVLQRKEEEFLSQVDWDAEERKLTDRERFDVLFMRYKADMEARYPFSEALVADLRWAKPPMEESKEDVAERRAVEAARRDALRLERSGIGAVPEASRVCRRGRMIVASKGSSVSW